MLNIAFRTPEEAETHPLQALCPWIDFITTNLILNKDGSLLAGFDYFGVDPDDLYDEKVDSVTEQIQRVCSRLDGRVTAWWVLDKRRDRSYAEGEFTNPTAAKLDEIYSKGFREGRHLSARYTLYLLFTPTGGTDKFFDRVARIQNETQASLTAAFISAVKESLSGSKSFARDVGTLRDSIIATERMLLAFSNAVPIKLTRLEGDGFSSALGALLNRASNPVELSKPAGALLDAWLPRNDISANADSIRFDGTQRTTFAGAVGIKKWPSTTSPMLFETLAKMDIEMTICQIVRFLDSSESSATIDEAIEYYNLTQFGLVTHAVSKASGSTPEAKPGKARLLQECKDAREAIGADDLTYAYVAMTVFIYGESRGELKRNCDRVVTELENKKFNAERERQNTLPAFAALLPGQWATQSRYDLISIENVADACPIYTIDEGSREHPFFSKQVFQRPVPKLATFGNSYGGRFNFTSHVDQVGHMLIIAPTGNGKSTFVNFCISQFNRYGKSRTIIFDRNRSCEIVTKLHKGTHIDLKNKKTKLNPLAMMRDGSLDGRSWVREFILRRLLEGGYEANNADRTELDHALQMLDNSSGPVSMSDLAVLLPKNLEAQLSEWLEDRPYGMFDSKEDDLTLGEWTTIEMTSIMGVDRLARAFLDLVFRKIFVSLDGTPTLIYIEEASFLVNDPRFAPLIDEWLKAIRARNGFLWMSIQSPESVTNAEMSASILDNIYTFLLLRNMKVETHRKHYRDNFGFEDHQIDMIANLRPKRDYLLIQDGKARVMTTEFTPEALAYVRSEKAVMNLFDKHAAEAQAGSDEWMDKYLADVVAM